MKNDEKQSQSQPQPPKRKLALKDSIHILDADDLSQVSGGGGLPPNGGEPPVRQF